MLSAICFNLDQSKILLPGNGLRALAYSLVMLKKEQNNRNILTLAPLFTTLD